MKNAEILSQRVLCREPGRYIGWPTITKAANGDLLAVFSGDRDGHVCMFGKTQMVRSEDDGKTWSPPVTITDTLFDDRDAGITTLFDGTLLLSWFTSYHHPDDPRYGDSSVYADFFKGRERWRPVIEKITEEDKVRWLGRPLDPDKHQWDSGHWTRRSVDNGYTWEEPVKVTATTPHGPVQLSDGSVILIGTGFYEGRECVVTERSYDNGKSWTVENAFENTADGEGGGFAEPHLVETDEKKIVAMFRYIRGEYYKDVLWQAVSGDGGKSWSKPKPSIVWGEPPHLIRLKDGRLLVTYGHRRKPYGERACLSRDGGRTWDYENEIILCDHEFGDFGYPASVELDDGTIITVYYARPGSDEKQCLMATYWRPYDSF